VAKREPEVTSGTLGSLMTLGSPLRDASIKKETAILIGAIALLAAITVEYVKGGDRISCDRQVAWTTEIMDMRLVRQYFDDRCKRWIAMYESMDGRHREVPQTFEEAMRAEWTGIGEWR
jgi:hypothetical protein